MIKNDKFVYIHVPRTGGTTVEDLFEKRHGLVYSQQHDTDRDLEPEDYGKFIFGFVRNPYSQEYSNWTLHCVNTDWPPLTFEEWVRLRFDNAIEELKEKYVHGTEQRQNHVLDCLDHGTKFCIRGQRDFFQKGDVILASKIYRFEELKESWDEISNRIGLDMRFDTYPPSDKYKQAYNEYTYDMVTRVRCRDLQTFNYSFDD